MSEFLKQAKAMFVVEKKKEWYEELEEEVCAFCPTMTYEQRLSGFIICMILGFIISMGSLFRLGQLLVGNPTPFATMYTLGNVISISATCFLYGPWAQIKSMFAPTRYVTTTLYICFMVLTLFLAFYPNHIPGRLPLLVSSILCQFLALIWYSLSFIPYGRDFVKNCCITTFGCNRCFNDNNGYSLAPSTV